MMPTILFLVTGFPPDVSGVSLFNWERAVGLSKSYRVVVIAPDWQSDTPLHPPIPNHNLVIDTYPSKPWLPYCFNHVPKWQSGQYIESRIAYHKPDLIVVTDVERLFLLAAWQLPGIAYARHHQVPIIAEYHTDLYNFSAAYPSWQWLRAIIKKTQITNYLYRQFDLTLCTSQAAQESCLEVGILNTHFLPFLGVDVDDFSPNLRDRSTLESWLTPTEAQNQVLLFVGRLGYEKRVDLLIEAFRKLNNPKISLLIVGDGPPEVVQKLEQQAAGLPNIHFTGFLLGEQKAKVMAACDIFCSPSPYETFGRTIIEAMASGLPVISVNSGAVAEYIQPGINGYLVPPDNPEALTRAIELATSNPLSVDRAYQDAQKFSIQHSCQQLNTFYQKLLYSPPSNSIESHEQLAVSLH